VIGLDPGSDGAVHDRSICLLDVGVGSTAARPVGGPGRLLPGGSVVALATGDE